MNKIRKSVTKQIPSDMHAHLDRVLRNTEIPVFMNRSKRLVYIRKPRNRVVAKLPRRLKKRIVRNLARSNKTYACMCASLYLSEYNRLIAGFNTVRDESRRLKGITVKDNPDGQDWFFVDHAVPETLPTTLTI